MAWLCINDEGRVKRTVLVLVVFYLFSISHCRRLSLKESLTAYAEDSPEQRSTTSENPKNVPQIITSTATSFLSGGAGFTNIIPGRFENSPGIDGKRRFSLLEITKGILFPSSKKESNNNNVITKVTSSTMNSSMGHNNGTNSTDNNGSYYKDSRNGSGKVVHTLTKESPQPQQAWQNFLTTVKNEFDGIKGKWDNKNRKNSNISKPLQKVRITKEEDSVDEQEQSPPLRSKKEVSSNTGLRDLLWNTATALWSVNKVHFLPTFLHTKTGGKLSLIRDSIFKPVTILSQFTNGVQEINNEKWSNLARLTSAGSGWTRPPKSQVVVIRVQPENSRLWTLARYIFRLTKHTTITKWRLKRALLDLQLRALRKLLRIISSKTVYQKLSTIKILTNAILNGKLRLLKILAGRHNTTHYYPGKDNSVHVDITYSSLGEPQKNNNNDWLNYHHQYEPPSSEFLPFRPMSPTAVPPSKINYYHYETPLLGESSHSVSVVPPPPSEPLIDSPSYANLLETMGIHPSSYDYDGVSNNVAITTAAAPTLPPLPLTTPAPTVVYYSSNSNLTTTTTSTTTTSAPYKSSLIEKPAASYSFHFSSDESTNHLDAAHSSHSPSLRSYLSSFPPLEGNYSPYSSRTEEASGAGSLISSSTIASASDSSNTSSFRLKLLRSMEGAAASFSSYKRN